MSTDTRVDQDLEDRCVMVSIAYLERNDFKSIRHITRHVISARDGSRLVYVWLSINESPDEDVVVPTEFFKLAAHDKARVDVIRMTVVLPDKANLKHMMNVTL